jgi:hypothetical protein
MKTQADPEPATFAEVLAEANVRKLAAECEVSVVSVYKWKSGKFLPGLDLVPKIAKALGWPTAKLSALVVAEQAERKKAQRP